MYHPFIVTSASLLPHTSLKIFVIFIDDKVTGGQVQVNLYKVTGNLLPALIN